MLHPEFLCESLLFLLFLHAVAWIHRRLFIFHQIKPKSPFISAILQRFYNRFNSSAFRQFDDKFVIPSSFGSGEFQQVKSNKPSNFIVSARKETVSNPVSRVIVDHDGTNHADKVVQLDDAAILSSNNNNHNETTIRTSAHPSLQLELKAKQGNDNNIFPKDTFSHSPTTLLSPWAAYYHPFLHSRQRHHRPSTWAFNKTVISHSSQDLRSGDQHQQPYNSVGCVSFVPSCALNLKTNQAEPNEPGENIETLQTSLRSFSNWCFTRVADFSNRGDCLSKDARGLRSLFPKAYSSSLGKGAHVYSMQGKRDYMEDAFSAVRLARLFSCPNGSDSTQKTEGDAKTTNSNLNLSALNVAWFGVFDGHGGHKASLFASTELPRLLFEERHLVSKSHLSSSSSTSSSGGIEEDKGSPEYMTTSSSLTCLLENPMKMMQWAYAEVERNWIEDSTRKEYQDGTTALSVLLLMNSSNVNRSANNGPFVSSAPLSPKLNKNSPLVVSDGEISLCVANVGDSRCIISRGTEAHTLTLDHKPSRSDERRRIEALGGYVQLVKNTWRVQGRLALSRALGDRSLKPYVSAEPEIYQLRLRIPFSSSSSSSSDCTSFAGAKQYGDDLSKWLIVATDGIWDVFTTQEAMDWIFNCESAKEACETLAQEALLRGSKDNITVIVLDLFKLFE